MAAGGMDGEGSSGDKTMASQEPSVELGWDAGSMWKFLP